MYLAMFDFDGTIFKYILLTTKLDFSNISVSKVLKRQI